MQNASVIDNPEGDEGTGIDENIDNSVTLTGREGKFQEVDTIHKKYSQRPDTLENMCLAQFATSYHSIKKSSDGTEWDKMNQKQKEVYSSLKIKTIKILCQSILD